MRIVPNGRQVRFFDVAKKLSEKAEYHHKLGAVIVSKNRIVGLGFNNPNKTHPRSNNAYRTVHAELSAVLNAGEAVAGCDIYIYRGFKDGSPAKAKPCSFCEKLLRDVGIANIYYSDDMFFSVLRCA